MNWRGQRVLVTGAGGFIGSHLTERLVQSGATVRAFVQYNGRGDEGWLTTSPLRGDIEVVAGDVRDRDSVSTAMRDVDLVFHLAALIAIPYSYQCPQSYVDTNVVGTLNVLLAARALNTRKIVHTSTSEVYGTARYVPIDESHPLQGQSPYSASKIGADKLAEAFHLSFGVPIVTVRPFNTFGPRQSARAIIPTIVTQALGSDRIRLGHLDPTRDFNYVSNTVDGFVRAAEVAGAVGHVINLGSGTEISIGDLVGLIRTLTDRHFDIETDPERLRPPASEVDRLLADTTRAHQLLGWQPAVSLKEGLVKTISWIREHSDKYQPEQYAV
jgi:NAD dependent epimerase/dehydratase